MKSRLAITIAAAMLLAGLALAEPRIEVRYHSGVPQVILGGDWAGTRYTIYRAVDPVGPFNPISSLDVLCLGSCYADDYDAAPGRTYWYRFDIIPGQGAPLTFGPYPVTISSTLALTLKAVASPNPSYGPARIDLFLAGSPNQPALEVVASLMDLQGRRVRTFVRGPLGRGWTSMRWDGRDEAGRMLGAGHYFLRFATPLGSTTTRLVRAR